MYGLALATPQRPPPSTSPCRETMFRVKACCDLPRVVLQCGCEAERTFLASSRAKVYVDQDQASNGRSDELFWLSGRRKKLKWTPGPVLMVSPLCGEPMRPSPSGS